MAYRSYADMFLLLVRDDRCSLDALPANTVPYPNTGVRQCLQGESHGRPGWKPDS